MRTTFKNISIILIGDTHSLKLVNLFEKKIPEDFQDCVFLHCGDAGEGFHHPIKERHLIRKLYEYMTKINSYLIICRGNHSNPIFFHQNHWANREFGERVYFSPDYSIYDINDKRIQIIGGGISIDRSERIIGKSWWENEEVVFEPERIEKVDILMTHIGPTNCGLSKAETNSMVMHYHGVEAMQGGDLLGELIHEMELVQHMSDLSECQSHYFGHYHQSHYVFDSHNNRVYRCLDIDEFKQIK